MAHPVPIQAGRPYEAPKIFRVRIAGDELAVTACKSNAFRSGQNPPSCLKSLCKNSGS